MIYKKVWQRESLSESFFVDDDVKRKFIIKFYIVHEQKNCKAVHKAATRSVSARTIDKYFLCHIILDEPQNFGEV